MTSLLCPLCGKNTSWEKYDPETFDMDIYVQDFKGLGRGKGFVSLGKRSILHDRAAVLPVKRRLLELLRLLDDEGHVSEEEIGKTFGMPTRGSLVARDRYRKDEVQALKAKQESIIMTITEITDEAYEVAEVEERDTYEDPLEDLRNGVDLLIEEVLALRARVEEEEEPDDA